MRAPLLSAADSAYAFRAAVEYAQDWTWKYDDDDLSHWAFWFQLQCDDAGTLDIHIPSAFRAWEDVMASC